MLNRIAPVLLSSFLLLGACASPVSTAPTSGAPGSSGSTSGPTPASANPTGAGPSSPVASASASAAATPVASAGSSLTGFACGLPVTVAGTASGPNQARPTTVRLGTHAGYDRIVFEYLGTTMPAVLIERVQAPFTHDPSGLPLRVKGDSFVRIRLEGVQPTYTGAVDFVLAGPEIIEMVRQGDYEAVQSWIVGLHGAGCVRTFELMSPARLVIDIAS